MASKALISIGLIVLGLAVLTAWRSARNEAMAEAAFPPEGHFLDVDGIAVHAVVMGEGPDVVLIHGSSGNTRDMTFALAPILAQNFRVIVFDRPGLGYSESFNPNGETIIEQADILQRAAAQLGADKPIVAGQSYGGSVSLAWAVTRPDNISALVLIAPAAIPWETPLDGFNRLASTTAGNALALPLISSFIPDWYVTQALDKVFAPQSAPKGYAEHFGPGLTIRQGSMHANAKQRANLLDEITRLQPRYSEISAPTEIVHGTADDTVGLEWHSERLIDQIPGAELIELPGIGHMPQVVAAPEVAAAIDRAAQRAGLR
ncbi:MULTISPECIES: alpha/beta fold hydrolase [unclassified Ruegeria]|uniref:alpha/beta fold hydrolase n=1 Tax=unclassified Ruegeria TaxID=2625375 RepID=UPI001492E972|nr:MULTISPECIES: alpha/beta hydrolase [unclassified Ruegeria]NOD46052.1 alpha/beta fold hydrolase [Ruegeria sp. HKCCD5849]NOD50648.1 alpha/beta fold hydrolase [Ruegeria sp. HKCCD5851]NOD67464.1 alpha/beta fold hydrolase [Ruegeria sp. HKCCD7303]